ncbi:MAG: hypothetical protein AAB673_01145 [Patescibacteria group bacterium]
MEHQPISKITLIKTVYFFLVSFVALMMIVFSGADVVNTLLRTYVFTQADNFNYYPTLVCGPTPDSKTQMTTEDCQKQEERQKKNDEESRTAQRQRDLVRDISLLVVGTPLFILHWRVARKKE